MGTVRDKPQLAQNVNASKQARDDVAAHQTGESDVWIIRILRLVPVRPCYGSQSRRDLQSHGLSCKELAAWAARIYPVDQRQPFDKSSTSAYTQFAGALLSPARPERELLFVGVFHELRDYFSCVCPLGRGMIFAPLAQTKPNPQAQNSLRPDPSPSHLPPGPLTPSFLSFSTRREARLLPDTTRPAFDHPVLREKRSSRNNQHIVQQETWRQVLFPPSTSNKTKSLARIRRKLG